MIPRCNLSRNLSFDYSHICIEIEINFDPFQNEVAAVVSLSSFNVCDQRTVNLPISHFEKTAMNARVGCPAAAASHGLLRKCRDITVRSRTDCAEKRSMTSNVQRIIFQRADGLNEERKCIFQSEWPIQLKF